MRRRSRTWCWWWWTLDDGDANNDGDNDDKRNPWWLTVTCEKVSPFVVYDFEEKIDLFFLLRRSWSRKELQTAHLGKWFKYFHSDCCSKQEMSLFSLAKEGLFKYLQKMVLRRDCRTNSMKKSPKPIMSFVQCDLIILHQRVEARSWNPSATQSTRASLSSSRGTSYQTCLQVW